MQATSVSFAPVTGEHLRVRDHGSFENTQVLTYDLCHEGGHSLCVANPWGLLGVVKVTNNGTTEARVISFKARQRGKDAPSSPSVKLSLHHIL